MPEATKLPTVIGMLLKLEASYAAGGSVAAGSDGFLLAEPAVPTLEYLHDGAHAAPPAITGFQRRVAPSGEQFSVPVKHEAKGPGAAYSASVLPTPHIPLRIAGFDAAVDTTGGAEKVTYTPTPGAVGFGSALAEFYARQQKWPGTAIYATLDRITAEGPVVPMWEFTLHGLPGAIADATVPSITYPALTIDPPKATNIGFTLGNFASNAIVKRFELVMDGPTPTPRANQNASSGHAGFARGGRRQPILTVCVEATALQSTPYHHANGLDPYNLFKAATELDCSLTVGGTQYNKFKIQPGKVQLAGPPEEDEVDGVACWVLRLQCNPTSINNNNDVSIIFS